MNEFPERLNHQGLSVHACLCNYVPKRRREEENRETVDKCN